jgi:hypothetical protein
MVLLSATGCSVSLVSFANITPCVGSQLVFIVVYFVIDSARKLLDTATYVEWVYLWGERVGISFWGRRFGNSLVII